MPKRATIVDRRLPALRAMRPGQLRAAIFAMCQWQRLSLFASPEPTSAGSSLDGRNRSNAEDNFCRLFAHTAQLTKNPAGRLSENKQAPVTDRAHGAPHKTIASKARKKHQHP